MLFAQGWHFTPIISPRGEGWSHITSFTLPPFIEVLTGTKQGTWTVLYLQGRIQGGHPVHAPPKIGKNMIFWLKIVIFHTKYPPPPLTWNPGSAPDLCVRGIDHLPLSIISLLEFGTVHVPTVWYVLFFTLYYLVPISLNVCEFSHYVHINLSGFLCIEQD